MLFDAALDPDRFLDFRSPGAQEWWYFDAISDDGDDALVLIWFAALPFDPAYGMAVKRHLAAPGRYEAPHPHDHCAINVSWYHKGRLAAYALNRYSKGAFEHRPDPFAISVAGNRLERDRCGYALHVETPALGGGRLAVDLRFVPAPESQPFERDLGTPASPHLWILAAPDGRFEGSLVRTGRAPRSLAFRGRGYHDHNAGAEELSLAMRRWEWGRVHHGLHTEIYYRAVPRDGRDQSLWITACEGRPAVIRDDVAFHGVQPRRSLYGVRHDRELTCVEDREGGGFGRWNRHCVDDGPFYQRWLSLFRGLDPDRDTEVFGITEILDTRRLHHPFFNWMIPFRLKTPKE